MGKGKYFLYFLKNAPGSLFERVFHYRKVQKRFLKTKHISIEDTGRQIKERIESGEPFSAIRFGGTEISCLNGHEKIQLGLKKTYKDSIRWAMKIRGGFFPPEDEILNQYCDEFEKYSQYIDYLAISNLHMEDYFYLKYCPNAKVISNWGLEPLLGMWSSALKGKKVLIITGFKQEILDQYKKREDLFPNEDILPEFASLEVLEAPHTQGDLDEYPAQNSLILLEEMKKKISEIDFDIALVGAGAYGSLLCLYCRSLGKSAIQTGGSIQTLFGIMGKRWENREHVAKRVNENWIRPYNKPPKGFEKIDKGAYW
ncbi:MAG: hypothetical protein K5694_05505 [Bacilli bacterium]|nr:hypothetical protein [Bacilli bacterium]